MVMYGGCECGKLWLLLLGAELCRASEASPKLLPSVTRRACLFSTATPATPFSTLSTLTPNPRHTLTAFTLALAKPRPTHALQGFSEDNPLVPPPTKILRRPTDKSPSTRHSEVPGRTLHNYKMTKRTKKVGGMYFSIPKERQDAAGGNADFEMDKNLTVANSDR